jgi:UDP-N-acetyl-D-galactosamine dehydrogenase
MEISTCEVLIMGLAFKKDCKDLRNSKVFDLAEKLKNFGANIEIFDPFINQDDVEPSNIFKFIQTPRKNYYDVIIIAVDHTSFVKMDISEIKEYGTEKTIVYDVKSIYDSKQTAARL